MSKSAKTINWIKYLRALTKQPKKQNVRDLWRHKSADWIRTVSVVLWLSTAAMAGPLSDHRTAEALFQQSEGCTQTVVLVVAVQNAVIPSTEWPDGWARGVWLTVETNDLCAGVQILNAAGQAKPLGTELAIDRKAETADTSLTVLTWDGIAQDYEVFTLITTWEAVGVPERSPRSIERHANATLRLVGDTTDITALSTTATIEVER